MLQEIFTTKGRINRLLYLKYFLGLFIASAVLNSVVAFIFGTESTLSHILSFAVSLPMSVGLIMVGIRRLHDLNRNGWLMIAAFIPFINVILEIYMFFFKGTDGQNDYGADPLSF